MKKYDFVIVGAGLFGSAFANLCKQNNKSCLIIEKTNQIGGNCYTSNEEDIIVHNYGPHIFHTDNKEVWEFVNKFSEFNSYRHIGKAFVNGYVYSLPINLNTIQEVFGVHNPIYIKKILENECDKSLNPDTSLENFCLYNIGHTLYNMFIKHYTQKQWNKDPKDLPASIIKRLPIRHSYNDNYFNDRYQGIPVNGYTTMCKNMINGIDREMNVDFLDSKDAIEKLGDCIIYTGAIDEYYNYCLGKLEYINLKFETQKLDDIYNYQGTSIVNYTEENFPYTRIIEHKHFDYERTKDLNYTFITKEYPDHSGANEKKYYPVNTKSNNELYQKYIDIEETRKVVFAGRLGQYKYFDMDDTIYEAIKLFRIISIFTT